MIGTGFANDGQKRNNQNRNTLKEVSRGKFKKVYASKRKPLNDKELSERKTLSEYKGVNDFPIPVKWILLALVFLGVLTSYFLGIF